MTGNKVLLDTSVVIELFKGNTYILRKIESYQSINICFAVLGELYFGAYRSANPNRHLEQINEFLNTCTVLEADNWTADIYAKIKALLLNKGRPIPENDIWIAAVASQHQLTLFTRDKHFNEITDLLVENQ